MKTLKIAQLSTPFIAVPPPDYGGTELVVYNLTEGLVKKGHQVTLFATGDSTASARLQSVFPHALFYEKMQQLFSPAALNLFWMHSLPTLYHTIAPFEQADKFDIIHNHVHYLGLFFASLINKPTIHTYHGDFSTAIKSPIERMILEKYKDSYWTAISETQKKNCPIKLNFVDVVHHGVASERFDYQENPQTYLIWLGRITPKKGVNQAIEVAKKLGKQLIIAGVVHDRDQQFFSQKIKPHIDNQLIKYVGALDFSTKVSYLKNAKLLLYPVTWEEPFGLVMIEAMACGTPVVAYGNGAVTEIVRDGETGVIVKQELGIDGLAEAVNNIYHLTDGAYKKMRRSARERVIRSFSIEKMADSYEKVYQKIINLWPTKS